MSSTIKAASVCAAGQAAAAGVIAVAVVARTEGALNTMLMSTPRAGVIVLGLVAIACVAGLLLVPPSAKAIPLVPFTDTPRFVEQSKDIVLAECLTDGLEPGVDGVAPYKVKVVHVIKGDRKLGKLRVGTAGLEKGRTYMLAGFGGSVNTIDFITNGELAVVELPPTFDRSSLKEKSTARQVQTIFDARREWVEARLRILAREKSLLDRTTGSPRAAEKDKGLLRGNWKVKVAEASGTHLPRETSTKQTWGIRDGEVVIQFEDGVKEKWTFTLDPAVTPRSLDLKVTEGVKAGASAKGIYELKGNTLRICFNGDGERPSRFDTTALGHSRWGRLFVLERASPAPEDKPK